MWSWIKEIKVFSKCTLRSDIFTNASYLYCILLSFILMQYSGHLMQKADSVEKTLMLGGIGGRRRRGNDRGWDGWVASPTRWTWVWVNSRSWWWTGRPGMLRFMGSQRVRHDWVTELNWTELILMHSYFSVICISIYFKVWPHTIL